MVTTGRILRTGAATMIAALALLGAACAPSPDGAPDPSMFDGGTYAIDVDVESQTHSVEYMLWGFVSCTTTVTSPAVDLSGTVTLAPAEMPEGLTSVRIPSASVQIPRATISVGSLSLSCDGHHIASVGLTLQFSAAASMQSATLDTVAGTVTLADPTLTITDASVTFTGDGAGLAPVQLDPITVTVPTLQVDL
jgi:hypothetical protein